MGNGRVRILAILGTRNSTVMRSGCRIMRSSMSPGRAMRTRRVVVTRSVVTGGVFRVSWIGSSVVWDTVVGADSLLLDTFLHHRRILCHLTDSGLNRANDLVTNTGLHVATSMVVRSVVGVVMRSSSSMWAIVEIEASIRLSSDRRRSMVDVACTTATSMMSTMVVVVMRRMSTSSGASETMPSSVVGVSGMSVRTGNLSCYLLGGRVVASTGVVVTGQTSSSPSVVVAGKTGTITS